MNISKVQSNCFQPSFRAKKQTIKDADKILRTSKETFPFVSSSYIRSFYLSAKPQSKNYEKAIKKANKIFAVINKTRIRANFLSLFSQNEMKSTIYEPSVAAINSSLYSKTGNCLEQARAALGVLAANGYYNSNCANLMLDVILIDKITHRVVHRQDVYLDHTMVLTDMNKEDGLNIVLDLWLGFADSIENAIGRYKSMVHGKRYIRAIESVKQNYVNSQGSYKDKDRYAAIGKIKIVPEEYNKDEVVKLGKYVANSFPEVVIR